MNRREFFGRAAALPAAVVIAARAPEHLAREKPNAGRPSIAPPSSAPVQGLGGGLAAPLIRTTRELVGIYDLVPGGVRYWMCAGSDYLGALESFTLELEGKRFTARHVRRLQLHIDGTRLVDVPGAMFAYTRKPGTPKNRILIDFSESLLDLRRVAQVGLCLELVDRCNPYRARVFATHWIGGPK